MKIASIFVNEIIKSIIITIISYNLLTYFLTINILNLKKQMMNRPISSFNLYFFSSN